MKKNIVLAIAVIGITTVSCRKQRTCECKTNTTEVESTNNGSITTITNTSDKVTKDKQLKKEFRRDQHCYSQQYTDISNNGKTQTTYVTDCTLD